MRPQLLVKGADYRVEDVVGGDLVKASGGEVVLAEVMPGYSTSATIARFARSA
jgi:D-beta-D-heptose 7-phosphate kinase/D-beta-D-heptose 1-phosphate adenosyltransferase